MTTALVLMVVPSLALSVLTVTEHAMTVAGG